jgi:acetyltransferase
VIRLCFLDYDQDIVLVAECHDPTTGMTEIRGVGHLSKVSDNTVGQLVLAVNPDHHDDDLNTFLLEQLIYVGQQEGLDMLIANVSDNPIVSTLCQHAGFEIRADDTGTLASLSLRAHPNSHLSSHPNSHPDSH